MHGVCDSARIYLWREPLDGQAKVVTWDVSDDILMIQTAIKS
jgi:hypothetical protein